MAHVVAHDGHAILSTSHLLQLVAGRLHTHFNQPVLLRQLILGQVFLRHKGKKRETGYTDSEA